ncbi:hypothetical protein [Actinoplanes sp. NBRC 103695]|uniref:hypothetical protein n=1 Tax=Actinoplanes sp. NBRC 103695 TaxID=3032202 RepID=UPI00255798F7|nr:hypothetical protein [Actinoplanes sp. NBRC 103695]
MLVRLGFASAGDGPVMLFAASQWEAVDADYAAVSFDADRDDGAPHGIAGPNQ